MLENVDVIAAMKEQVESDPVTAFLDKVAGRVLEAADTVEQLVGPLDDVQYGYVVAVLAQSASVQLEMRLREKN
jgi:hypothetical protein